MVDDINSALKSLGRMMALNDILGQKKRRAHFVPPSQDKAQRRARKSICVKRHNDKIKVKLETSKRVRKSDKSKFRSVSLF